MRLAILAVIATGCGGHASPAVALPAPAAGIAAMRWVPARPSYVFASSSVDDAQRGVRGAIDGTLQLLGILGDHDLRDAVRAISGLLGVDALHPDPLASIGVDLRGSWAMFSDELSPTLVVHLGAPDQMATFLERQRERGLVTQSVIIDKTEVFTATLPGGVKLGWAIAGDWMWIHVGLPFLKEDGTTWFTASHAPHGAAWTDDWVWAQRAAGATSGLVGFLGHPAIASLIRQVPDAIACANLIDPVGRAAVSLDGDDRHFAARITFDIGPTDRLRAMILPRPSGWDATAAHAALAAQWNLDLAAARSWLAPRFAPCIGLAGGVVAMLDETGVRTARGVVLGLDPDSMSGSGAIAFDTTGSAFFERQLDRIPLRRTLERSRTFGAHKGHAIAIPFSVTVEYVLEPGLAIAALGEGVVAALLAPNPMGPAPIFALDVAPPVMSAGAWETVLHALVDRQLTGPPSEAAKRVVEHLMRWRDARIAVTAEPGALVFTLSGNRR